MRPADDVVVEAYEFAAEGMHIELYDNLATYRTGGHELDVVHPGWFIQTRDVGDSTPVIASYLWRHVCGTGLTLRPQQTRQLLSSLLGFRWNGAPIIIDVWQCIIEDARQQLFELFDTDEVQARLTWFQDRPMGAPVTTVAACLCRAYNNHEALDLPFTRWDLAQAFAEIPQILGLSAWDRSHAQAVAGLVALLPIEQSLPALEPFLVK
jgi:hypothetical protein